jgi:arylsulfatase A-like enzyme
MSKKSDRRLNRREFIGSVAGTAAAGLLGFPAIASAAKAAEKEKLNVLFIMSDQHNARAMSCAGNEEMETPNLDRLAAGGVRFPNAFCQTPQSCPSRYTIWTGRYAHSHGCRWNGVVEPLDEVTIGEIFSDAGYSTATIGKHHMVHHPSKHGFAYVVDRAEHRAFLNREQYPDPYVKGDWLPFRNFGPVGASAADNDHHPMGFWTSETIKFLREHKEKPFCAWYSFYGPHTPIVPSEPWASMCDPDKLTLPGNFSSERESVPWMMEQFRKKTRNMTADDHRKVLGYYYGLVSQMDYNIGRVLDELQRLGLAEKTIVVYTADHGEMMAEHGTWTKYVLGFDATVRVPMIIRVPGGKVGKVAEELVGSIDLMPTLCELAGLDYPSKVQGRSMVSLVEGRSAEWRKTIFSEIGYPGKATGRVALARTHTHKYVHHENRGDPYEELFDYTKDPWETRNEIDNAEYADVVAALKRDMKEWEETTDHAPMYPIKQKPTPKPATQREGQAKGSGT